MRRICGILLWTFSLSISQANQDINPSIGSIISFIMPLAGTLPSGIMPLADIQTPNIHSQFMELDKDITLDNVPNQVTDNDGQRYSCSMSSGFLSRMASPNLDSFGHLENLTRLCEETKSNHWQKVEFQVYSTDHYMFWHAGLKITFHSEDNSSVYALDWGMNNKNNLTLFDFYRAINGSLILYHLKDHEVELYEKCNKLMEKVNISIESDVSRSELQTIMLKIRDFPKNHTYNPLINSPSYGVMNCRGFCVWVIDKLKKAEFDGVTDMGNMGWLNNILVPAGLVLTVMASGSGSYASSSVAGSSATPSAGPHSVSASTSGAGS